MLYADRKILGIAKTKQHDSRCLPFGRDVVAEFAVEPEQLGSDAVSQRIGHAVIRLDTGP
jgi:hypothetical protein